jgi:hypothetical protein
LGSIGFAAGMLQTGKFLYWIPSKAALGLWFFTSYYKSAGVFLWIFGSREVWQMQMQVLSSPLDTDAMNFKKSVQEDSSIVAVAVSESNIKSRGSIG